MKGFVPLVTILLVFSSCERHGARPLSEQAGREALGQAFDTIQDSGSSEEDLAQLEKMALSGDPFVAGAALEKAASLPVARGRRVLVAGASSRSSLVRDKAMALMLQQESDAGGTSSSTWAQTRELFIQAAAKGAVSEENLGRFASIMGTDGHGDVRDSILLHDGVERDRLFGLLCLMELTDKDVRFLIRHGDSIHDQVVFDRCDESMRRATFGKKRLGRGVR